jgi:hypothetical protein
LPPLSRTMSTIARIAPAIASPSENETLPMHAMLSLGTALHQVHTPEETDP